MSLPHDFRLAAREDIDAAYVWYEAQQSGRGATFLAEVNERIEDVCATPELFPRVSSDVRAAPLLRSRYIIYYQVEAGRVVVLAVQHESADPKRWQRRT